MRGAVVAALVGAAGTMGCDQSSTTQADAGDDAGVTLPPPTWSACSLLTDGTSSDAECTQAKVPLDWSQPDGQQITYFVKRYRPPKVTTKADLWMIAGGPGAGGESFEAFAAAIAAAGQVDVYMPDHRGSGRSSRLSCAMAEAQGTPLDYAISTDEMKQCLSAAGPDAGTTLAGFTPSNAARDIGWMVSQTRTSGRPVYVYGVSYGTYLTLRYLQLFPTGADGVVLDSLCSPDGCFLSRIDTWANDGAKSFFDACGQDAFCSGKLGSDPWAQLGAALDKLDANSCPAANAAGFTRASIKPILNELIGLGGFDGRSIAPVLAYRIMRCSVADQHALAKAGPKLFPPAPASLPLSRRLDSPILTDNIALSELYDSPPPSIQAQQQIFDATYVSSGRALGLAEIYDVWPRYPADPLAHTWPTTTLPILIMRGGADYVPASLAQEGSAHFSGSHQQFVVMPRAQHDLLHNSTTTTPQGPTCAQTLLTQFILDPTATLDLSCTNAIRDYGFPVDPAVATAVFGTSDAWEGDPGP
jgi:pimeloyl-ACP methyl ester carboxylesterase